MFFLFSWHTYLELLGQQIHLELLLQVSSEASHKEELNMSLTMQTYPFTQLYFMLFGKLYLAGIGIK